MRANGTTPEVPSRELLREINALKAQLKKISATLEADATEGVSRAVGTIESRSKEAIDDAIATAQNVIDEYAENAKEYATALGRKSEQIRENAANSLIENVQARPLGTIAALVGIGFLAGFLCRRS